MLGLGNSMATSGAPSEFTPESISNLQLWLKFNQNITSDQEGGGSFDPHDHSTAAGNMTDTDKINAWNAFGSTSINAVQTTQGEKPVWETDAPHVGGLKFPGGKIMELSSDVVLDENTDFTIAVRFNIYDFSTPRGIMGSASNEFIRASNNTTFRLKVDNVNRDFALASGTIAIDEYYTIIIVRSAGSTGNLNVFIRGNESFDGTATGTQVGSELQDTGEITIDVIGGQYDNATNLSGFFKDILIWDGTAASSGDRKEIFDYIEAQ